MAIPADAKVFLEFIDPYDVVDFQTDLAPLLEDGEAIAAHSITVPTESSLYGLGVITTGGYTTTLTSNILKFYLAVDVGEQANAVFTAGVTLPLVISITTNATPPRKRQRTIAVKVIQR